MDQSNSLAFLNDMGAFDSELDQTIRSLLQGLSQPNSGIPTPAWASVSSDFDKYPTPLSFPSSDQFYRPLANLPQQSHDGDSYQSTGASTTRSNTANLSPSTGADSSQLVSTCSSQGIQIGDIFEMDGIAGDASLSPSSPLTACTSPDTIAIAPKNEQEDQNKLSSYHNQIAGKYASHLSSLISNPHFQSAGLAEPHALAATLSRAVMGPAIPNDSPSTNERLSIQQRRRLSHLTGPPPPVAGRKRQLSAPGSCLPGLIQSPPEAARSIESSWTLTGDGVAERRPAPGDADHAVDKRQPDWSEIILSNSHDMVFVLSLKGTVLYMSPSVLKILGFLPEEIIGRPLVDFCHPADVGPLNRELKESAKHLPNDEGAAPAHEVAANEGMTSKGHPRVDVIMRMMIKTGGYALIEATGSLSFEPPKHRKVLVCSGRPHPIPMLPWDHVRGDLLNPEPSGWLKIAHNGIFLGSTGPVHQILGIEDVNLMGRHIRDLPMVASSSDLLEALRVGRSISVQDYIEGASEQKAPVKLTVYPWTSSGRSHTVAFVHVQRQPRIQSSNDAKPIALKYSKIQRLADLTTKSPSPSPGPEGAGAGRLTGMRIMPDGGTRRIMSQIDADSTVFCELTGFHNGSWLIEMQKLQNANKRLRHELSALSRRSSDTTSPRSNPLMAS